MSKVVHLMGISGSGKSTLANLFRPARTVLHVDTIQMSAGPRLCPFSKVSVWEQTRFWEPLFGLADVPLAVMLAVEEQLQQSKQSLSSDCDVILEGNFLRVPRWRDTFELVLKRLGVDVRATMASWLDPPTSVILKQRGNRNQTHDLAVDEAKVDGEKRWFAGEIERYGNVDRYETSDAVRLAIEAFLNATQAN